MDKTEGFEKAKEELVEAGFAEWVDGEFKTKREIAKLIEKARFEYRKALMKTVVLMVITPIFKYYMLNSPVQRLSKKPFPSLEENPSAIQLTFLNLASDYYQGKDLKKMVLEKLEMEKNITYPYLGIGISGRELGIEFTAKLFGVNEELVREAVQFLEKRSGKGEEFLKRFGDKKA